MKKDKKKEYQKEYQKEYRKNITDEQKQRYKENKCNKKNQIMEKLLSQL